MSSRAKSLLFSLIGDDVLTSLSPTMHEREAVCLDLRPPSRPIGRLELGLAPTPFGELLQAAALMSFNGGNVTHPGKQPAPTCHDQISDDARVWALEGGGHE